MLAQSEESGFVMFWPLPPNGIEATISDSPQVKKNLQNPSEIKKNTSQSQHIPFFSKYCMSLIEKRLLMRIYSVSLKFMLLSMGKCP